MSSSTLLPVVCTFVLAAMVGFFHFSTPPLQPRQAAVPEPVSSPCTPSPEKPQRRLLPTLRTRKDLAALLERENFRRGAELGVQQGHFAQHTLKNWPSAAEYLLVDLWKQQSNYKDIANRPDDEQEQFYQNTIENLQVWSQKVKVCRNSTVACATTVPDAYFDYIYVDARHDWKGVEQDLVTWWPKLREGGIMAGHDYVTQRDVGKQDWTLNFDGTRDTTGLVVQGAVDTFFMSPSAEGTDHFRQVVVTYRENNWNTWYVRK